MNILIDPLFENWAQTANGSGVISVVNGILTASASIGDNARVTSSHVCNEGEVYIFSCDARVTNFDGSNPAPGLFIDHPSVPNGRNRVRFDSTYWKNYELKFTVPKNNVKSVSSVVFGAGVITDQSGAAEIRNPMVRLEKTAPMSQSIWARGRFTISSTGALTVSQQSNIVNAQWQSGGGSTDSDLLLTVHGVPADLNITPHPRAFLSTIGPDSYIAKTPINITGGSNGQFNVKILDVAAGAYIKDNPASTTNILVEVVY